MRRHQKLPLCQTKSMLPGNKMNLPLVKDEAIRNTTPVTLHLHKKPSAFSTANYSSDSSGKGICFPCICANTHYFLEKYPPAKPAKKFDTAHCVVSTVCLGRGIEYHVLVKLHVACETVHVCLYKKSASFLQYLEFHLTFVSIH